MCLRRAGNVPVEPSQLIKQLHHVPLRLLRLPLINCWCYVLRLLLGSSRLYSSQGPLLRQEILPWRGYAAYIAGILINIVGFVGAIGKEVPIGATYIYRVNFFAGFIVAGASYWALCHFFPIPATSDVWMEVDDEAQNVSMAYGGEDGSEYDEEQAAEYSRVKEAAKKDQEDSNSD
jgi:hypothetical protein